MKEMTGENWFTFKRFIKTLDRLGLEPYKSFENNSATRIWRMWGE